MTEKSQEIAHIKELARKTNYDFESDKECATFVETIATLAKLATHDAKSATVQVITSPTGLTSVSFNLH